MMPRPLLNLSRICFLMTTVWIATSLSIMTPATGKAAEADLINRSDAVPETWTRFHGPGGFGNITRGKLPDTWNADDYVWSADLGGVDVGSPIATATQVFILDSKLDSSVADDSQPSGTLDLVAFDIETGKEQWRRSHRFVDRRRHARNSPASTTPAVSGDRVFIAYGDSEGAYLAAYSITGDPLWSRDLGPWSGVHGFGTSPMVDGNQVILFNSQQVDELESWQVAGDSRMMSFDVATGKDLWSTPLKATRPCYGVPTIYTPGSDGAQAAAGPHQLIAANKGNGLFGLDPTTGKLLWSLAVFDKRCCSSPLVIGDLAIGSCGSGGGGNILSAVRIPKNAGDSPEEVFRLTSGAPYVPTSAVKGSLLFTISDAGIASCFDMSDDGRKCWSQRIGGNFGASPVIIGDRLLLISLDGIAHVTAASDEESEVSQVELGGRVGATPAVTSKWLILRVGSRLHCLSTDSLPVE
jgi:outer membrane protein assembly factor BamB